MSQAPPLSRLRGRTLLTLVAVAITCVLPAVLTATADAASLGSRTLRVGDHGADVKALQKLLNKAGMSVGTADGEYGSGTKTAVSKFQKAANLQPSGTAGTKTIRALRAAVSGKSATTYQANGGASPDDTTTTSRNKSLGDRIPLKAGMSGHDVKVLQDYLKRAGISGVSVDGEFGSGTAKSVKTFETQEQLPVDGVVDANDIDVLRGLVDAGGSDATVGAAPLPLAPGDKATINSDGLALAPASAPDAVKQMIAAGNKIAKTPYIYGGGHGKWEDKGYDCSGSVSYALHGAGLLDEPLVSGDFPTWGTAGPGQWVTIYGNSGHVYMVIAGLRFDTSGAKQDGSRWHTDMRPTKGYGVSHPTGL